MWVIKKVFKFILFMAIFTILYFVSSELYENVKFNLSGISLTPPIKGFIAGWLGKLAKLLFWTEFETNFLLFSLITISGECSFLCFLNERGDFDFLPSVLLYPKNSESKVKNYIIKNNLLLFLFDNIISFGLCPTENFEICGFDLRLVEIIRLILFELLFWVIIV